MKNNLYPGKQAVNDFLLPVAAAVIIHRGEVLAARRRKGLHLAGHWEFPGGKIEEGETPQECLVRELLEELGIHCRIDDVLGESIYQYSKKRVQLIGCTGTFLAGTFRLVDHDEVRWVAPKKLRELNWAPADLPLVEKVLEVVSAG